jgi:ABC-type multidrug transport system fused ATPase/permease subunit
MSWVSPLLRLGNKTILDTADLYPLDSQLSASIQSRHFQKEWRKSQHTPKAKLVLILFKSISWSLFQPIPSRLAMVTFSFCQPFFIGRLIRFLESDPLSNRNTGLGLILASLLIYPGLAVSSSNFSWLHSRAVSKARSALVTAIFQKTIELNSTHLDTNILTLMSTDVERITQGGLYPLHDIWANTVEVILASFFLHRQLGSAFIAPILVVSASVVSTSFIAKFTGPAMSRWTQSTEARVRLTTAVVASMKALKISGLSESTARLLQKSREDEQRVGSAYRILVVVSITSAFTPVFLAPAATFFWAGRQLSMAEVFSSLSYVALITSPLTQLFQKVPDIIASFACLTRIQNFLDMESRSEYRKFEEDFAGAAEQSDVAISLGGASLGWTQDRRQLKELNLTIPRSSLTIVTGPVASGKSTLCKALLGEAPFAEGSITFHEGLPRIGYCDQTPFLTNGSIRSNIVGFEPWDGQLYDEVLDTVMLKDDLRSLPKADNTPIGSSGISLSGGQKQRVGLARALYLGADVYILDDCTVGLDKPTAEKIVSRLFGPRGFLSRRNATIVWCTRSVQYLPLAPQNVIVLNADGRVEHDGQPEEVLGDNRVISTVEHGQDKPYQQDVAPDANLSIDASSKTEHEDEKDPSRSLNDTSVYTHYFSSFGPLLISAVLFSGLMWGFFWNAGTLFLKYWADNSFHIPGSQSHVNNIYLGIYALLQLSGIIVMGLYVASTDMGMARVGGSVLHFKAVKALTAAPLQYFTKTDQGVTVNLFSQDINLIDFFLPKSMSNTLLAFFASAGQAVVVAIGTPFVALAYPVLLVFLSFLSRFYLKTSRQLRLLDLEAKSPLYTQFQDTIRGIATIRAFGWVPHYMAQNYTRVDDSLRPAYLLSMSQVWLMLVLKLIVASIAVSVTVLATQVISLSGRAGFVGAGMVSLMELGNMMNACVHSWIHLEMSLGAVKRLKDFGEKSGTEDKGGEDLRPAESWPERGEIVIGGVDASYKEEKYKDDGEDMTLVLKDIRMSIKAGEKVAIIGRTGSGKSSMILLLLRLLDPTSETAGNITIDGTPVRKIHRDTLRQRVIAMPQEMVFLAGGESFRTALDPYSRNTDEECQFALEQVGLWSVIQNLGGLQTEMTKDVFSQGQKQLFSLAIAIIRARLRKKHGSRGGILLLDEVTASVDRETEQIMMKIIQQVFADYTVVAVTHNLESIAGFGKVIAVGNGRVIKEGTPDCFSVEHASVAN